ncbi:hypothetical protein SAMN04488542_13832 [Fontibacillus panacisegetis]|uniref:Uncharacterized protein n=1 Tax=Fontibacillus panacisegetis TaxID=670482 RepID=A0A1G7TNL8_9BACL|nr:hypothetical protein [Fontibacillus panacisegetis]SDG36791.1 hypothetical protein SAMN04488542_13832 [Fontibacillus panacisegetis]
MPLIHEFLVFPKTGFELNQIVRNDNGRIDKTKSGLDYLVEIDDDLFQYFSDTLNWIPTESANYGFNYYGLTEIHSVGATKLKKVIKGWFDIFESAPDIVKLTGNYTWSENINEGKYEKIYKRKDDVLKVLFELMILCNIVEENNEKFLLHMGI